MSMKGAMKLLVISATIALLAAVATAQPPGAAGLVWMDDKYEFDLNAGFLVTSGAISTTISLGNPGPTCLSKDPNTLDIQLNLSQLFNIPGLPTITLTGTALANGSQINWSVGQVIINRCLRAQDTGLPFDILIDRITGGNLRVNATILNSPYYSAVCQRDFWVRMDETGGNALNYVNVVAYAFCIVSPFTQINATLRDLDFVAYSGPIPEPASLLALSSGLVGLVALRRRRK